MDPQPPAETPPAPASAPAPAWTPPVAPPPAPVGPPARPGSVTTASILLIVIGVLVTLLGLLFILLGTLVGGAADSTFTDQFGNLAGAVGGVVAVFGIIFAGFGILEVLSGIYMLAGRSWARILAIILSVLGGLVSLGGVAGGTEPRGAIVFPLVLLVCYVFIIWAAAAHGKWFAGR